MFHRHLFSVNYILPAVIVIAIVTSTATGYPSFTSKIPNGDGVTDPCMGGTWLGVGHQSPTGSDTLNVFGRDMEDAGNTWTRELCAKDSDGDGRTNGEELGDPNCTWQEGTPFPSKTDLGHPGVCEPLNSPTCQSGHANQFLRSRTCTVTQTTATPPAATSTSHTAGTAESVLGSSTRAQRTTAARHRRTRRPSTNDHHGDNKNAGNFVTPFSAIVTASLVVLIVV